MKDTKRVHPRLPVELAREINIDAARQDKSVQDWIKEAAQAKLADPGPSDRKARG